MADVTYKCYQIHNTKHTLVNCTDICTDTIDAGMLMIQSGFILISLAFIVLIRPIITACFKRCCCTTTVVERTNVETRNDASIQCDIEPLMCKIIIHPDASLNMTNI